MVRSTAPERCVSSARQASVRLHAACAALAIAVACVAIPLSDASAATLNVGYEMFPANVTTSSVTGEKPQSKLWYHDGAWWAILRGPDGVAIYEKGGDTWYRGAFMDAVLTASGEADVKWNGTQLLVLVYGTTARYFEYTYDSALRVWNLSPGFPVAVPRPSGSETMVLEQDSSGRVWTTAEGSNNVNVYYTTSADHRTWSKTPIVLRNGVDSDDISSIVAFGGDKIGVFWSDQKRWEFGFRIHLDADPPATWQSVEIPYAGYGYSDDHIHLAADSQGRVFAITKDAFDRHTLLRREVAGTWTRHYDVTGGIGTRGIIMLSEADNKVYALWTNWQTSPDRIGWRSADMDELAFGPTSVLMSAASSMNNVTGTKQSLPTSCLMAVAEGNGRVLWNGWGSPGGTSFDPPQPPTNLIATLQNAPDRVELSWSGPASGTPEGYIVYRQHDGGAFVRLVAGLSTPTTFTDNAPLAGNLTYKVTAFAHQQEGGASDLASVTYTPPPPPAPSAPTAVVATPGQAVLVTGAAAWPLDEGTGQTVADATGLGHTGQFGTKPIADSNDPTWTTGIAGGALRFDGSNDRVLVADAPDLRFAGSFTLEAWVQRTSIGKEGCIVAKGDTGRRNFWMLFDASNRIDFRWQTPSGKDRGARTLLPFTDLGWHHVACIWDQQALQNRIYYDGILVHSAADTGTPTTSAEPMYIGAKVTSGSVKSNFHGNLDLVRVSPGALYGGPFVPQTNFDLSPQPVVQVAWAPPLLGIATGYNVYREQPDSTFALMTPIPVTAMSWQDTAPPSGGACYRVSAIDAWAHEGDLSDVACAGLLAAKSAPVESETHSPPAADLQVSVGPNPFNPTTTIHFRLASAGPVRCSVYDVRGTRVAVLLDGSRPAGQNVLTWNADRVASGTYFLVVQADGLQEKRKLVLLK